MRFRMLAACEFVCSQHARCGAFEDVAKLAQDWHVHVLIRYNGFGHSAGMPSRLISGTILDSGVPDWAPLESVLGSDELCDHFMWMSDILLEDGTVLNAYKHRCTRGYIHLDAGCAAYRFMGDHGYAQVPVHEQLAAVFERWDICQPTSSERAALAAALARAEHDYTDEALDPNCAKHRATPGSDGADEPLR